MSSRIITVPHIVTTVLLVILIILAAIWIYFMRRNYVTCETTENVLCPTYTCYHTLGETPANTTNNNLSAYRFYGQTSAIQQKSVVGGTTISPENP